MTKTGILCLESGIQDPYTGHRFYEPVICTRVGSYLFLLLIELSCCLYLDVVLYNRWNLLEAMYVPGPSCYDIGHSTIHWINYHPADATVLGKPIALSTGQRLKSCEKL